MGAADAAYTAAKEIAAPIKPILFRFSLIISIGRLAPHYNKFYEPMFRH